MIEFYEHNELNPRNLKSLVDQHKNLIGGDNKNEVPQQVVQEEAEVRNDADEDHDDIYEKFNIKPPEMQLNQNQQVQQLDQNQPFNNIPNQSMNASGMMYAKQIYTPTPFEEIKDMDLYDLQDIPEVY